MKKTLIHLLYGLGLIIGSLMVLGSLAVSFGLGHFLGWNPPEPEQAIVADSSEIASPDYQGRLLELQGVLKSSEVLEIPEYGIQLKAAALWVDARVFRTTTEPTAGVFCPLSEAATATVVTAMQCPAVEHWSQILRMGNYNIDSALIAELLHTRSRSGLVCERSFLPLPPEHIHLPESLRGMARLLPDTQGLDRPDCTIYRLAERYLNPDTPTEPTMEGDVELRFSYLPAEMPAAVRGRYFSGEISKVSSGETAFAANGQQLPPVDNTPMEKSMMALLSDVLTRAMSFSFPFFFLLSGISLFCVSLQRMSGECKPLRFKKLLLTTLILQLLAIAAGCLSGSLL